MKDDDDDDDDIREFSPPVDPLGNEVYGRVREPHNMPEGGITNPSNGEGEPSEPPSVDPIPSELTWPQAYGVSSYWGERWRSTTSPENWPVGVRLHGDKMVLDGRICVPELKASEVVREHHDFLGHVGVQKTFKELERRYVFPPSTKVYNLVQEVRRQCVVCQTCEPPNYSCKLPISFTPIPEYVMASVALDVFALPSVTWGKAI